MRGLLEFLTKKEGHNFMGDKGYGGQYYNYTLDSNNQFKANKFKIISSFNSYNEFGSLTFQIADDVALKHIYLDFKIGILNIVNYECTNCDQIIILEKYKVKIDHQIRNYPYPVTIQELNNLNINLENIGNKYFYKNLSLVKNI